MKEIHGWAFPQVDEFMAKELKADGTYQRSHYVAALAYVTDRSRAIDGGAHVGTWSRLMSADFQDVIAVEPSHDTAEALETNMARYGCGDNVRIKHCALAAKAGLVSMVLDGRGATLHNTGARHVGPGTDVRAEAIDDWALPSLGFLKLDVEGSEVAALEGAVETIARCHPVILFENKGLWRTHYGLAKEAPQQWLTAHGYKHLEKAGCDAIWGPVR